MSKHTCPKCGSDHIQTFQMIWDSGTSTAVHDTTGVGVGVGSGGGIGLGFGGARTQSASVSTLAAKVAPPTAKAIPKFFYFGLVMGALMVLIVKPPTISEMIVVKILGVAAIAGCGYNIFRIQKWNKEELPPLVAAWEKQWLCHKCGNSFTL